MLHQLVRRWTAPAVIGLALCLPATAAADNVITVYGGLFVPRGEDSRTDGDTINENLPVFLFEVDDFNGFTFGGEWHFGFGDHVEAGVGVGYYQQTVPSVYRDLVAEDEFEIEQDFKLRVAPVTFTARFYPTGRTSRFQPYVGGGLGIAAWRYTETGDFVDPDGEIFRAVYEDSGNAVGPVVLAGIRFPVTTNVLLGGEFRYFHGDADLDPEEGFFGDEIDLGHTSWLFTAQFGF